jgi:hypothetical protein
MRKEADSMSLLTMI